MSRRQQRRRASRRTAHAAVAGSGMVVIATLSTGGVASAAQTFPVTNLNDSGPGSLRAAAAAVTADTTDTAPPGDSIVFASGLSGTLSLTGTDPLSPADSIYISRPVQLLGPGADRVTIHAAPNARVLDLEHGGRVSGLTLTGGVETAGGGGIYSPVGSLELDGVVITGNSAKYGAAVSETAGTFTISGSTISGNVSTGAAAGYAGAVFSYYGAVVTDSTITGNTGPTGAGVDTANGNIQLTGSTVAGNTPTGSPGGQLHPSGAGKTVTLRDSIVAGSGSGPDIALPTGTSGTASFSLIRNAAAAPGGVAITTDSTDVLDKDPLLSPLAANGGPTPTRAPSLSSPVLDHGKSFGLTTDQRGLSRPFALPIASLPAGGDRSDIGAVEEQTPAVSGLSPSSGGADTRVAISGTGFTGATEVLFGSTPARSFTVLSDAVLVAVAPPKNGPADVRVSGPFGESPLSAGDRFTFPRFTPTARPKHPHAKLRGHNLKIGENVGCPTGGPSCMVTFKLGLHKLKLGGGSFTLAAGSSRKLTLKLKPGTLARLHRHHGKVKVTLTITATNGAGSRVALKRTAALKI